MRLRSSQFVFFLLLACSVQVGEGYAFRLIAGHVLHADPSADARVISPVRNAKPICAADRPSLWLRLSPGDATAERTPWSMSYPASASAAVASFTGLLRA